MAIDKEDRRNLVYVSELYHHGIKGQRWGVRRYQNPDGTLTPEGREHYGYVGDIKNRKDYKNAIRGAKDTFRYNKKFIDDNYDGTKSDKRFLKKSEKQVYKEGLKDIKNEYKQTSDYKTRKAIKIGLAAAGTALALYGGYKLYKNGTFDNLLERGKPYTDKQLRDISVSTFDFETFAPETFKPETFSIETELLNNKRKITHEIAESIRKTGSHPLIDELKNSAKPKASTKSLDDFEFHRVSRVDEHGRVSTIDLPIDKEGYADVFARKMVDTLSKKPAEDYKYWYDYIMNKIRE